MSDDTQPGYTVRAAQPGDLDGARALLPLTLDFVAEVGDYDAVALHTDPRSLGAERFWRSMPTTLILDDGDGPSGSLHFELAIPARRAATEGRE